jgi:hypothetical protein
MRNLQIFTIGAVRDISVNQIVISGNSTKYAYMFNFGLDVYNIVSTTPIEMAIAILGIKLGITNKIILSLIIAFLL